MVEYNPKDWFTFIFRFHKADTIRQLFPLMVSVGIYSVILTYLEVEYFKLPPDSPIKNLSILHNMLGFMISMLLVFRTNTAYDRWWEGRRLWGQLMNNSRNLVFKLNAILPDSAVNERKFLQIMVPNIAFAIKNHLRNKFLEKEFINIHNIKSSQFNQKAHIPNQMLDILHQFVYGLGRKGILNPEDLLIINPEMQSFMEVCGACERIKTTPIPFSYSIFIKKVIFSYTMTLPLAYAFTVGYWVGLMVPLVLYAFASLELVAEEIENPFGTDANDLPLDKLCTNLRKQVNDIFEPQPDT